MDSVQGTESRSGKPGKKDSGYKEAVLQTPPGRSTGRRKPGEPGLPDACSCMRYDADEYERQIKQLPQYIKKRQGFPVLGKRTV